MPVEGFDGEVNNQVTRCKPVQRPDTDLTHVANLPRIIRDKTDERESSESYPDKFKPQLRTSNKE